MQNYKGLSIQQVKDKQEIFGKNIIDSKDQKNLLIKFLEQFINPLIIVLLIVVLVSLILGEYKEAIVISIVIIINAIIGFIQENRAKNAIESIKQLVSPKAKVWRNSQLIEIDASEIVPGDITKIDAGVRIPADGKLIYAKNLSTIESQLTGESYPIDKNTKENPQVYMATIVSRGSGVFEVTKTGINTEIGKVSSMVSGDESTTPLDLKLKKLTKFIIYLVLISCIAVFFIGLINGSSFLEMFKLAVSLGVSSIPEGLPIVVTVTLSIGVIRMSQKNAILRNLSSASTLASVDYICTDKTGTITEGKLVLDSIFTFDKNSEFPEKQSLEYSIICNDAEISDSKILGDPLDIAILEKAQNYNLDINNIRQNNLKMDEIPFDSDHKYQAVLTNNNNSKKIIVKGAFEILINKINATQAEKNKIQREADNYAKSGLKVLTIATKNIDKNKISKNDINELNFEALLVFVDPLRSDVYDAINTVQNAGINIILLTGDHLSTAKYIAKKAGIEINDSNSIESKDLENLPEDFDFSQLKLIARAKPEDKVMIIDYLHSKNKTVAMTGDGVNDAPALFKSDIGISMGIIGTDAAREASDMILMDDKFSTIIKGIEQARLVYENIKKTIIYIFSTSVGEVLTIVSCMILGLSSPINPLQILWLNLVTDGFLTIPLALEKKEGNELSKPPNYFKKDLLTKENLFRITILGITMAIVSVIIYLYLLKNYNFEIASTGVLVTLAAFQWFNIFNVRSSSRSIFSKNLFSNKSLFYALGFVIILTILVTVIPFTQDAFSFVKLDISIWILCILSAFSIVIVDELRKLFSRN